MRSHALKLAPWLMGLGLAVSQVRAAEHGSGRPILGPGSTYRYCAAMSNPVASGSESAKGAEWKGTPLPPKDWRDPEFDDHRWARTLSPRRVSAIPGGHWGRNRLALLCSRSRFEVADPAAVKGLRLSLAYLGGAVVYVNGKEIGRGHMPEGAVRPGTLAEEYPKKAYFTASGKPLGGKTDRFRARKLTALAVPAKVLRKGVNVLAVEVHRSAYNPRALRRKGWGVRFWNTCGLVGVELRADAGVKPNIGRPAGVQVWPASMVKGLRAEEYADPVEKRHPLEMVGVRNGTFCAMAVVSSDREIPGVKAVAGELKQVGGKGVIGKKRVTVFYPPLHFHRGRSSIRSSSLDPTAPGKVPLLSYRGRKLGAVQPVWVRVKVPADATPGEYRGKLSVTAGGKTHELPVHLRVIDWKLPDPKDWAAHMGALQSPDTLALKYKVPLWSEKHWKLMEKSFELMGELGNNYAAIPLLARTNLGNSESMVRWIRKNGSYSHDFSIAERYLDLARKHGRLDAVCLYGWECCLGGRHRYWNRWEIRKKNPKSRYAMLGPAKVTLLDPKTKKTEMIEGPWMDGPDFKEAEARTFWEPVYKGMFEIARKRGLDKKLVWGMVGDGVPAEKTVKLMKEVLPGVPWSAHGHHNRVGGKHKFHGVPVLFGTAAYGGGLRHPPGGKTICGQFPRVTAMFGTNINASPLARHRHVVEWLLDYGRTGLGRIGADFWNLSRRGGSVANRYPESDWFQLNLRHGLSALLAQGPDGAMPTVRFDVLREGYQEAEAWLAVQRALSRGKVSGELAARCRKLLSARKEIFAQARGATNWYWLDGSFVSVDMAGELFSCAAEVARETGR